MSDRNGISYGYLHAQAQVDGYGTHLFTDPAMVLGGMGTAQDFGVPDGYEPDQFVLVGKAPDATSSATPGNREAKWSFFTP